MARLQIGPNISALQYGISVFEGMKAHKSADGHLLLFRARENALRLQRSAARLAMPPVPESLFRDAVRESVRPDQRWIPPAEKGALAYSAGSVRVDPSLRVKPADRLPVRRPLLLLLAHIFQRPSTFWSAKYARAFP